MYWRESEEAYSDNNLYHNLIRAWTFANGCPLDRMYGLAYIVAKSITDQIYVYYFYLDDQNAFQQLSYATNHLCSFQIRLIRVCTVLGAVTCNASMWLC